MKQFTHAWLAMMAMKRIEYAKIPAKQQDDAKALITWFKNYRDFVLQGAWYPDFVFKDMSNSHICKYSPADTALAPVSAQPVPEVIPETDEDPDEEPIVDDDAVDGEEDEEGSTEVNFTATVKSDFRVMPETLQLYQTGLTSDLYGKPYVLNKRHNLCDRCESFTESLIDSFKMLTVEQGGSPIIPSNNHIALRFFILSHYIADGHMPLHCDARSFYNKNAVHSFIEQEWDDMVQDSYYIDEDNNRFFYDKDGYPLQQQELSPLMKYVEDDLLKREFIWSWGDGCGNTWDYMSGITQYSYLMAYRLIPADRPPKEITKEYYKESEAYKEHFMEYSKIILGDAVESIAKIWLHAWVRYRDWFRDHELSYLKAQLKAAKAVTKANDDLIDTYPAKRQAILDKIAKEQDSVNKYEAEVNTARAKGNKTEKKEESLNKAKARLAVAQESLKTLDVKYKDAQDSVEDFKAIERAAEIAKKRKDAEIKRYKDKNSTL